jgi:acetolactate synthase-1/2/3 large subunit
MNGKKRRTGAEVIAEICAKMDMTHVFFVEAMLYRTKAEMADLGMHRIQAHTEKAAAYMADGYARASRKPAVCMAQSVGAANLAAGLQDAYLGHSPVISITGRRPPIEEHRNAYQEILHDQLFNPVTKFHANAVSVEQLPFLLRQAFREATTGKPGPVHIDFPGLEGEFETHELEMEREIIVEKAFSTIPPFRPVPADEDLKAVVRALAAAEKPVIVAGGGVNASLAGAELVELAEKLSIPVATSVNGKGAILENHHLYVGVVGQYSRWCTNRIVHDADLVIFVGSQTGDQTTNFWKIPSKNTPVIQIDIAPEEIGRNYPDTLGLVGDAKSALKAMNSFVDKQSDKSAWLKHAQKVVEQWKVEYKPLFNSDSVPIQPERLCSEIQKMLPDNAVLVSDTGHAAIRTSTMIEFHHPNQRYIRCAGSLGWGFPASLGVKCALTDRPVFCFTGDGGFWYHISELETACRCGINTVTIINNNSGFGQVVQEVVQAYGDRPGNQEELYKFTDINFANIASEIGCWAVRVEKPQQIEGALKDALASGRPAVVDVVTDINHVTPLAWSPT